MAVRVAAVSVGRLLDVSARAGTHPYAEIRLPHVLGAEHAGTVAAVGAGVESVRVGDLVAVFPVLTCGVCPACRAGSTEACATARIMGVHTWGSYAEYTVAPESNVFGVPAGVGPEEAAALALSGPVAQNQFDEAGLQPGEWVLVYGGSSALGSLTAALAAHAAPASSRHRGRRRSGSGSPRSVDAVLDPTVPAFAEQVLGLTGGAGVGLVVDNLGDAAMWSTTADVLAVRGRIVTSGAFLAGRVELDLLRLYSRSQRIIGVRSGNLRSARRLWDASPTASARWSTAAYPISRAAEAHRYLEDNGNTGRVVLTTADNDWDD